MRSHRLLASFGARRSYILFLCLPLSSQVRPSQSSDESFGEVSKENTLLTVSSVGHILHERSLNLTKIKNSTDNASRELTSSHGVPAHASSWLQSTQMSSPVSAAPAGGDWMYAIFSLPVGFVIGSALIGVCAAFFFEQLHVNTDKGTRDFHALKLYLCIIQFLFNAYVTIVIPESASLAESMGRSPVDSGYLIGCVFFLSGIHMLFLNPHFDPWRQEFMGRVALLMVLTCSLSAALYALGADPPTNSWDGSTRFAICLIARTILPGADGGSFLFVLMILRVTPVEETVDINVVLSVAKIFGFGSGVLMSALATQFLTPTDVGGRAAYPLWFISLLLWIHFIFGCFLLPTDLSDAQERKSRIDAASVERRRSIDSTASEQDSKSNVAESYPPQSLQSAASVLPETLKRQIWTMGVLIGAQRALVVSSVESATTFILEQEFNWTGRAAGVMVCLSLWAGIPVYLLKSYLKSTSWPMEVTSFRIAGGISVVASLLFVKSVGQYVAHLLWLESSHIILLADAFLYPAAYMASALMDGLVATIAMPETSYNMDNYFMLDALLQNSFARGCAPVYARYMIYNYGRNSYAWTQFGNLTISLLSNIICVPLYLPLAPQQVDTGPSSSTSSTRKQDHGN
mmetsp:Transcript_61968/g.117340  ORF Transcript_61968/g.117340 Transcript_61968/m.117340 type:complete len:631 (-) Transcript_61968:33-1925(-)